ncbi:MAG: hypothetical protein KDD55_09255 [Bdellovibrionales bacterium]|nr:hypothetical protein [Bdellovibrionales bacterium]
MTEQGNAAEILALFDLSVLDFQMILVCAVVFYLYTVIASKTLFGPLMKLYEAREQATIGAESSASETIREAESLEQEYGAQLTEARIQAMQEKLEILSIATKDASGILGTAENTARDEILSARQSLEASREKLRAELFQDADAMAQELAGELQKPLVYSEQTTH